MLVEVLVTTLMVGGGVVVTPLVLERIVVPSVSFIDVFGEELDSLVVPTDDDGGGVVRTVVSCCCVVPVVLGNRESTTPIGPVKSTSESGQDNSSG